jgi:hypothetical protein
MNILFTLLLGCTDTTKLEQKLSAIEAKLSAIDEKSTRSKRKVMVDYKVIKVPYSSWKNKTELTKIIKNEMKEGWVPFGSFISGIMLFQELVKYEYKEETETE